MKAFIRTFPLWALVLCLFTSSTASAKTDIEFILDLSGSMRKVSGGESQIASARKALFSAVKEIPEGTLVALRVYGHRVEQTNKVESCKDSELVIPFGSVSLTQIQAKVSFLAPKGYTPIAYSLEKSKEDFGITREADKVIILLSDGEETCEGDPVAVVKKLQEQGFKVVVHTVGFNVDAVTKKQLQDIAQASGGKYFDAQGAAALREALKKATQESLVIEKEKTTYGSTIRGGNSYETAVPIEYNKEYKLDHHQKKNEFDYFSINLQAGQELTVELRTLEKGVSIRPDKVQENTNPYAALQLHGDTRNELKKINIIGDPHANKRLVFSPPKAGRYYVLLGSTYADMNKDHVTFKLTSVVKGDLGTQKDAGDHISKAMPMEAKRYLVNYLGGGDHKDVFSFQARKGEVYFVGLIPNEEVNSYFQLYIFDAYKQRLMSKSSGTNAGLKTNSFTIPNDGAYFLEISFGSGASRLTSYTLELKKVSSPPAQMSPKQ